MEQSNGRLIKENMEVCGSDGIHVDGVLPMPRLTADDANDPQRVPRNLVEHVEMEIHLNQPTAG
jgi:hypothetical protein